MYEKEKEALQGYLERLEDLADQIDDLVTEMVVAIDGKVALKKREQDRCLYIPVIGGPRREESL